MYSAKEDKVYITQNGKVELFLTVHPTDTGGTISAVEQAEIIADKFNELWVCR